MQDNESICFAKGNLRQHPHAPIRMRLAPQVMESFTARQFTLREGLGIHLIGILVFSILVLTGENQMIKTLLEVDEDGTYEIEDLFKLIEESVREFGAFPVELPAIPFISPTVKTLKFDAKDVSEIKRLIERSN